MDEHKDEENAGNPGKKNQAGTRFDVDRERFRALRSLLNFMLREKLTYAAAVTVGVKHILQEKRAEKTPFTNTHLQNFVKGNSARFFSEIQEILQKIVSDKISEIPPYIKPLVRYCFPDFVDFSPVEMGTADSIFLQSAAIDDRTKTKIQRTYTGVFDLYRYSAHIYYDADVPQNAKSTDDIDAVIVRAQMQIYEYELGENFARFRMYYQPNQSKHYNQMFEINGIVVPIKNLLYFIGFEGNYGYPIIIQSIVEETPEIQMFMGMVMRYSEKIICSRVGFKRSQHTNLEYAKSVARVLSESEARPEMECFGKSLMNEVKHKGKSALVL